jgi:acyl carrier protein
LAVDTEDIKRSVKQLIVEELDLRDSSPDAIEDDAPLFGAGLGLDSLDALQLAMAIEERFGVRLPEGEAAREVFASVATLAGEIARLRAA